MAKKNLWTAEQDDYLIAHWQTETDEQMAEAVGHPISTVKARRGKLQLCHRPGNRGPDWTQDELDYISEVWGEKTIPQIARHLGRSVNAVKIKCVRLGYTGQKWYGNMMSARKVSELLGVDVHAVCDYWIPKHGLPGKRKRLGSSKQKTTIIMFDDLLQWLENHQDLWDSRRVELYGLGMEYEWLQRKRASDALIPKRKSQLWTPEEDRQLISMFRKGDMTMAEMGAVLHRPASGVEHRLTRLDVWGTGHYIGNSRSESRKEKKEAFEKLTLIVRPRDLLLLKRNSMDFGMYWQKDMCMNWDDIRGCTSGCTDCDECTEFVRIKPQYCARCGCTFYERTENRFCGPCRIARKKRAQRHYCRSMAANK